MTKPALLGAFAHEHYRDLLEGAPDAMVVVVMA